jgi:hypothetical protein
MITYDEYCSKKKLQIPENLEKTLSSLKGQITELIYWSGRDYSDMASLVVGMDILEGAVDPAPDYLIPILPVDEASIACIVLFSADEPAEFNQKNPIIRWHLESIDSRYQGALLDVDVVSYLNSIGEELDSRADQMKKMDSHMVKYDREFTSKNRAPRGHIFRPLQLACQNVVVGLATLKHDSGFDGLRVSTYLSCEVPHLATHEAGRAMIALILCDAFQNGGTMEVRFGYHNDGQSVPAAVMRFGRTQGIEIGKNDPDSISPADARELFLSVTPMPYELRLKSFDLIDRGAISPERLCYTIMSGIWNPIELDYLLSTSSRSATILEGGSGVEFRLARQAESESCRASLMTGMLFNRLNNKVLGKASNGVQVFEDYSSGVNWNIKEDVAAVFFDNIDSSTPWLDKNHPLIEVGQNNPSSILILPRACPTKSDIDLLTNLQNQYKTVQCALLVPSDMVETIPDQIPALVCPDRLAEIDLRVEQRLVSCRVGRT